MPEPTARGFGRLLVAVYAVFAVAATARSLVQIASRFDDARFAYVLSAFAGVAYLVATIALALDRAAMRTVAWAAIGIELVGVLTVGTLSIVDPALFPDSTVWSEYGKGYGYVPLVLPFIGLWWLARTRHPLPR